MSRLEDFVDVQVLEINVVSQGRDLSRVLMSWVVVVVELQEYPLSEV